MKERRSTNHSSSFALIHVLNHLNETKGCLNAMINAVCTTNVYSLCQILLNADFSSKRNLKHFREPKKSIQVN